MNIYVGNLPFTASEDEIRQAFAAYGTVAAVSIIKDHETGQSRGFAFVEMPNSDEGQAAITNMNGKTDEGPRPEGQRSSPARRRRRWGGGERRPGGFAELIVEQAAAAGVPGRRWRRWWRSLWWPAVEIAIAVVELAAVAGGLKIIKTLRLAGEFFLNPGDKDAAFFVIWIDPCACSSSSTVRWIFAVISSSRPAGWFKHKHHRKNIIHHRFGFVDFHPSSYSANCTVANLWR